MNHYLEKSMRIISDLVAFCHADGAEEFQIHMRHDAGTTTILISAPMEEMPQEDLDELITELNLPRQHEIEQGYWELSGESEMSGELTLVGMMVDGASVEYRDGVLYIKAWRTD